ncbi:MAG: carboxylesterase family protein [Muribaculaceae bacterium]|nr:carboxylesterase family protein [Muribaculaceae bacterium]
MRFLSFTFVSLLLFSCASEAEKATDVDKLTLDPEAFVDEFLVMPQGDTVKYHAYRDIFYITKVEDSTYQTLNIFVPENVRENSPVLLRTYIGGYMASKARSPHPYDATGLALKEGLVVCIPGSRGINSTMVSSEGKEVYIGICPNGLLDLKAAVRYLRHNAKNLPCNMDRIFADGTSAGGAMVALLGATGNARRFQRPLVEMGAAKEMDDIFAVIAYCPITDLNHADMEYEWLYGCTNDNVRHLDKQQLAVSDQLAALCPAYINSLELRDLQGKVINAGNYREYLKKFLIASAQRAIDEGVKIPANIGVEIIRDNVISFDLDRYLKYIVEERPLKTPPAFDSWGVLHKGASPENKLFGDSLGEPANFTEFSLRKHLDDPEATLSENMDLRNRMMNPMGFIGTYHSNVAQYWYIRHGAKDRDTSFLVPLNLATLLRNQNYDVDFFIPWGRSHSGDYNLGDLFEWINTVNEKAK